MRTIKAVDGRVAARVAATRLDELDEDTYVLSRVVGKQRPLQPLRVSLVVAALTRGGRRPRIVVISRSDHGSHGGGVDPRGAACAACAAAAPRCIIDAVFEARRARQA